MKILFSNKNKWMKSKNKCTWKYNKIMMMTNKSWLWKMFKPCNYNYPNKVSKKETSLIIKLVNYQLYKKTLTKPLLINYCHKLYHTSKKQLFIIMIFPCN